MSALRAGFPICFRSMGHTRTTGAKSTCLIRRNSMWVTTVLALGLALRFIAVTVFSLPMWGITDPPTPLRWSLGTPEVPRGARVSSQ